MSRVAIGALLATFVAFPAYAMSAEIDTDGDGKASLSELQAVYPGVTAELFDEIDTDADGLVNDEELAIAVANGILPEIVIDA